MKVYVAARFYEKELVLQVYKLLQEAGHEISADWTMHKNIKPYSQNLETAKDYAVEDIEGVRKSDIFILLLGDQPGTGVSTELGVAIMSFLTFAKPKIYLVGNQLDQNFCFFHPVVIRKKTIGDVLQEINK